jgi:hypothetical protein
LAFALDGRPTVFTVIFLVDLVALTTNFPVFLLHVNEHFVQVTFAAKVAPAGRFTFVMSVDAPCFRE